MRSAVFASIASILIASMLLGSVLISNVYAKGSGAEKSKYNLEEACKDDVKGKQITLTGSRSTDNTDTRTDTNAKVDKDAQRLLNDGGIPGRVDTDFNALGQTLGTNTTDGTLGIFDNNKHK